MYNYIKMLDGKPNIINEHYNVVWKLWNIMPVCLKLCYILMFVLYVIIYRNLIKELEQCQLT